MGDYGRAILFMIAVIFIIGFIIGYFIFRNRKIGGILGGIISGFVTLAIIYGVLRLNKASKISTTQVASTPTSTLSKK